MCRSWAPPRSKSCAPWRGPLEGAVVDMVNSTAVGGGVAEILTRLLPLARELGLDARWHVMEGGPEFYDITKAFHNALHGNAYDIRPRDFEIFLDYNRRNRERLPLDGRFVVIHDPQPAAFIETRSLGAKQTWIWRCHIDLSRPNPAVWNFLEPFVSRYDGAIFSSPGIFAAAAIPQYLFYPSIDPLSDKNRDLDPDFIEDVLSGFRNRPPASHPDADFPL